jgi:hypothetical protein
VTPSVEDHAFRRHLAVLSAVLLLGYLLTFSASHFGRVSDGQQMVETALSLHEYGSLAVLNPAYGTSGGAAPSTYSKYGLGFPLLLQVPLFLSDHLQTGLGWREADLLFGLTNLALNLLTALLMAGSARRLGLGVLGAWLAALSFAFGSFAWPYISYDFSEPLQAFCLTLAFWALLRAPEGTRGGRSWLLLSGFSLGFGVLTKATLLVAVPVFAVYLWMRTPGAARDRLRAQCVFWSPVLLWGIAIAALNWFRFRSILESGYGAEARLFTTRLWTGLYGLLLGPNKGLLFYAPVTLLLPLGLRRLFAERRPEFVFVSSLAAGFLVPVATWWSWEGGVSWGPRLLYPVLPFLVLASVYPAARWRWAKILCVAALLLGAAANLTGVLFYFGSWGTVIGANRDRVPVEVEGRRETEYAIEAGRQVVPPYVAASYVPALSPLRGHAWILRWRWLGLPFPMAALESAPAREAVPFGPVSINFRELARLCAADRALWRDLRSAQLLAARALGAGPDEGRPLPVRGTAFLQCGLRFLGEKKPEAAYQALRRARELGCDSAQLLPSLGVACVRLGKLPEGSAYFEEYLERVPDAHGARLFFARSLEANGFGERARAQYERLRELLPDGPRRAEVEERIAALSRASSPSSSSRGAGPP